MIITLLSYSGSFSSIQTPFASVTWPFHITLSPGNPSPFPVCTHPKNSAISWKMTIRLTWLNHDTFIARQHLCISQWYYEFSLTAAIKSSNILHCLHSSTHPYVCVNRGQPSSTSSRSQYKSIVYGVSIYKLLVVIYQEPTNCHGH